MTKTPRQQIVDQVVAHEEAETSHLAEAIEAEAAIATEAEEIRGNATELDRSLFLELWPLLRRPIPEGFIVTTGSVQGKPYESTGIKSVQVQIDRMDNVLTPLWWGWETDFQEDGKLARVEVWVGARREPLFMRSARGGVNRGSTIGNVYKGTETNAAKLAIARVGPGHEVYVGATDLDPDVSPDAAKAQQTGEDTGPAPDGSLVDEIVPLAKHIVDSGIWDGKKLKLELVNAGATDTSSVSAAVGSLSPEQAEALKATLLEETGAAA